MLKLLVTFILQPFFAHVFGTGLQCFVLVFDALVRLEKEISVKFYASSLTRFDAVTACYEAGFWQRLRSAAANTKASYD